MPDMAYTEAAARATAQRKVTVVSAVLAIVIGLGILYGVGLAQPAALHNAAHDARHATGLPCH